MSAVAAHLPNARVLDLFAGSGALGLEALSRGAREVTFVEQSAVARRALDGNIERLNPAPGSIRIVRGDVFKYLERLPPRDYDLALADPPYRKGAVERITLAYTSTPFARVLCIEHSRDETINADLVVRQRRYGDTMLTFIAAEDAD